MTFDALVALLQTNDSVDEIRFIKLMYEGTARFHVVPNSKKLAKSFGEAFLFKQEFAELRRRFPKLLFADTATHPAIKKERSDA